MSTSTAHPLGGVARSIVVALDPNDGTWDLHQTTIGDWNVCVTTVSSAESQQFIATTFPVTAGFDAVPLATMRADGPLQKAGREPSELPSATDCPSTPDRASPESVPPSAPGFAPAVGDTEPPHAATPKATNESQRIGDAV